MSSFTSPLIAEFLDNGIDYKIHEQFAYHIGELNSGRWVQVPVGYVTDLASTPRILWAILPPNGKYGKAAVIHDYLCTHKKVMTADGFVTISRKEADEIFYEAMGVLGVPEWKRKTMWAAVRAYAIVTNKQ